MAYANPEHADPRRYPTDPFIETIRGRYPVERELDAILTRKMVRRRGSGYTSVSIDVLEEGTRRLIAARTGAPAHISNARWLAGGASKLQMVFDLEHGGETTTLVLRMEPAASVTESSRRREFEVLKAVEGVIPAPRAYWVDADAEFLPYPALVCGFVQGAAKPSSDPGKVTGLGQNYGPVVRQQLIPQFIGLLGRLHGMDLQPPPFLNSFERPEVGSNKSILRQVNAMRRIWEEDRLEDEPAMAAVYKWLIRHAPELDRASVVHGDYRSGNFLFDEEIGTITAVLDWEGSVIGDRHQDLTYAALPIFQHLAEDGQSVLSSGMLPEDELYQLYAETSGLTVDPERIAYFRIYNRYAVSVLLLASAARASACSATHQDVLLNHVSALGYIALSDLIASFEEVRA